MVNIIGYGAAGVPNVIQFKFLGKMQKLQILFAGVIKYDISKYFVGFGSFFVFHRKNVAGKVRSHVESVYNLG